MRFGVTAAGLTVLLLLAGCGGDGTIVLQVRTDLAPGSELVRVVVEVEPVEGGPLVGQSRDVADGDDWSLGVRVAELNLAPGSYRATVSARGEGDMQIVGRPVRFDIVASEIRVVTVLLTRDCQGVVCPVAGGDPGALACVGGRCAPEECSEDTPELCASPECTPGDGTCTATAACAVGECTASGTCFASLDHSMCEVDERCDPDRGCVPVGGVADVRTCSTDLMCESSEVCSYDFGSGFGRCQPVCVVDAECPPTQRCTGVHCLGDACDAVTGAGCPTGYTCDFRTAGASGPISACRPVGTTPHFTQCVNVLECAARSACVADPFGQSCVPFCVDSAGCAGEPCLVLAGLPVGACGAACDVVLGGGCDAGRACRLGERRRFTDDMTVWTGECGDIGSARVGDSCTSSAACEAAAYCEMGVCTQICDLDTPACLVGTCVDLDPPTMIDGVRVGRCL